MADDGIVMVLYSLSLYIYRPKSIIGLLNQMAHIKTDITTDVHINQDL